MGLDEGVDDGGGGVPPHGEADPNSIVVSDVLATPLDGGTGALVFHLQRGTRVLVAPVEVGTEKEAPILPKPIGIELESVAVRATKRLIAQLAHWHRRGKPIKIRVNIDCLHSLNFL